MDKITVLGHQRIFKMFKKWLISENTFRKSQSMVNNKNRVPTFQLSAPAEPVMFRPPFTLHCTILYWWFTSVRSPECLYIISSSFLEPSTMGSYHIILYVWIFGSAPTICRRRVVVCPVSPVPNQLPHFLSAFSSSLYLCILLACVVFIIVYPWWPYECE